MNEKEGNMSRRIKEAEEEVTEWMNKEGSFWQKFQWAMYQVDSISSRRFIKWPTVDLPGVTKFLAVISALVALPFYALSGFPEAISIIRKVMTARLPPGGFLSIPLFKR